MAGLIFGILIFIVGIAFGIYLCINDRAAIGISTIFGGLIIGALCIFAGCCVTVPTGHTGVLTTFGRVEDKTLDSGFHTKAPWNSVVKMDNRVQKADIELSCFSSDLQEVSCKYALNYQINKGNAQELYRSVGTEYYSTAIEPVVAESVKTVVAHYTAEQLIGSRDTLANEIEMLLVEQLSKYNIEVVSTAIEDLDFTDAFTNAVEAKQVAQQNKLKAEIEQAQAIKQAEADAAVAKTKAEADAEIAKVKANSNAQVAKIQAEADKEVAQIGADSAEYQGKKEAAIALQRLASINGWSVVTDDNGINKLVKSDGTDVTPEEISNGANRLMQYYYTEQWDGVLPTTYIGSDDVSTIINPNN